jgi:hypothetical protein
MAATSRRPTIPVVHRCRNMPGRTTMAWKAPVANCGILGGDSAPGSGEPHMHTNFTGSGTSYFETATCLLPPDSRKISLSDSRWGTPP